MPALSKRANFNSWTSFFTIFLLLSLKFKHQTHLKLLKQIPTVKPVSWKITGMHLELNRSFIIMVWAHRHKFQTKVNFLFPVNNKLSVTSEGEGAWFNKVFLSFLFSLLTPCHLVSKRELNYSFLFFSACKYPTDFLETHKTDYPL